MPMPKDMIEKGRNLREKGAKRARKGRGKGVEKAWKSVEMRVKPWQVMREDGRGHDVAEHVSATQNARGRVADRVLGLELVQHALCPEIEIQK